MGDGRPTLNAREVLLGTWIRKQTSVLPLGAQGEQSVRALPGPRPQTSAPRPGGRSAEHASPGAETSFLQAARTSLNPPLRTP